MEHVLQAIWACLEVLSSENHARFARVIVANDPYVPCWGLASDIMTDHGAGTEATAADPARASAVMNTFTFMHPFKETAAELKVFASRFAQVRTTSYAVSMAATH